MKQPESPPAPPLFRNDINGLRALAVSAVVLFHFGIGGLQGGFSGVDVFFVLSGFLMSSIIVEGLQQGRFSILSFYWARARRIWPALIVVCAGVLVAGWILLIPEDYEKLGRHARQSLFFLSNKTYLKESGYFDASVHSKWLLHTWSLSVEWQFYLLLPLLLTAVWKLQPNRRALLAAHGLLFAASFVTCLVMARTQSNEAFYLLQSRAWELLLGGLCYLMGSSTTLPEMARRALEAGGLLLIVGAAFLLDSSMIWPGYLTLLPTLGTVLVLQARRNDAYWSTNTVIRWLGERSYSIYLWHWPLVALLHHFGDQGRMAWTGAAVALSLALGELSYRFVEQPARRRLQRWKRRWAVVSLLALVVLVGTAANLVVRSEGVPQRMPREILTMLEKAQMETPRKKECLGAAAACVYGGPDIRLLLIGDSHATAAVSGAVKALPSREQGVFILAGPACLTVTGLQNREHPATDKDDGCVKLQAQLPGTLAGLDAKLPLVIINRASVYPLGYNHADNSEEVHPLSYKTEPHKTATPESLQEFSDAYVESVCNLARTRPVYLMRPVPELLVTVPTILARRMLRGDHSDVTLTREAYRKRHAFIWQVQDRAHEQCGVGILDPLPYLCDERQCYGSRDGKALYTDDNHLNRDGSALLAPLFAKVVGPAEQAAQTTERHPGEEAPHARLRP